MKKEKILSICIPTYNRGRVLERLLANLLEEIAGIQDSVEICISDNGSTDDTSAILRRWEAKLPLRHRRNPANLGYDRNALLVTKMARGRYLWYMGDDDLIVKNSVRQVVDSLEKQGGESRELGVFYLNNYSEGKWLTKLEFDSFQVFRRGGFGIPLDATFAGSVGLNRRLAFRVIDQQIEERDGRLYKKNFGALVLDGFVHSYLFLECMKTSDFLGVGPDIGMISRADGERTSYKKNLYIGLLMRVYLLEMKKYYPWFNQYTGICTVKEQFVKLALACEDPELEGAYLANYRALLKVLELEGKPFLALLVRTSELCRRVPFSKPVLVFIYKTARRRTGLDSQTDTNPVLETNMSRLMRRAEEL